MRTVGLRLECRLVPRNAGRSLGSLVSLTKAAAATWPGALFAERPPSPKDAVRTVHDCMTPLGSSRAAVSRWRRRGDVVEQRGRGVGGDETNAKVALLTV